VRDRDDGTTSYDAGHRLFECATGSGVDLAGGLVEDEHSGIRQENPCQRDLLRLGVGERMSAAADDGVQTVRDAVVQVRAPTVRSAAVSWSSDIGPGAAINTLSRTVPIEDVAFLGHQGHVSPQRGPVHGGDVDAADADLSGARSQQSGDDPCHRRLSGTGRPDEGQPFTVGDIEIDAGQDILAGGVLKVHVLQTDRSIRGVVPRTKLGDPVRDSEDPASEAPPACSSSSQPRI